MKLTYADLSFDDTIPVSTKYDDLYFSREDGEAESKFVFFDGNDLLNRWQKCRSNSFCIAETGFGSGLNIALCMQEFLNFRAENPKHPLQKIHFISFELHPIRKEDLATLSAIWPKYADFYSVLLANYPPNLQGIYRIELLPCIVSLDLVLGDINESIKKLYRPVTGVDAWFLDGFAPSKNQSMWHEALYTHMNRLSRRDSSLATFTSAGAVKRGLHAQGFELRKIKGYGRKREMLIGKLTIPNIEPDHYMQRQAALIERDSTTKKTCSIIGGGIAGFMTALAMLKRNYAVRLYCKGEKGDGASGNLIGGFYPQLQADYSIASQFYYQCFEYAKNFYRSIAAVNDFGHDLCGALLLAFNDKQALRFDKIKKQLLWPSSLATVVTQEKAAELANIAVPFGGLYIKNGGWISPKSLVDALCKTCQSFVDFELFETHEVTAFTDMESSIKLSVNNRHESYEETCDIFVIAGGADAAKLLSEFDLRITKGQIEYLSTDATFQQLQTLICHKGYFTPQFKGQHALGSTYDKNSLDDRVCKKDSLSNFKTHKDAIKLAVWEEFLSAQESSDATSARASLRCSTPDHLPIVGNLPNHQGLSDEFRTAIKMGKSELAPVNIRNCFVLSGLGSRGLTTAPLCAEILASQINGECLPLSSTLLDAINPCRFLVRDLKRH